MIQVPVILLFGLSGVGKTTLADWVTEDLDYLHFNFDNWDGKGLDGGSIQPQWAKFFNLYQANDLSTTVRQIVAAKSRNGSIVTFPSNIFLNSYHIEAAHEAKLTIIILDGDEKDCINAFRIRELEIGRNLSDEHWHRYNDEALREYSNNIYEPYKMPSFINHGRRERTSLLLELEERASSPRDTM